MKRWVGRFSRLILALLLASHRCPAYPSNLYGQLSANNFAAHLPATNTLLFYNNGNLTDDGTRSFAYTWENQLTNITAAGQWRTDFVYDGLGRSRNNPVRGKGNHSNPGK